MEAFPTFRIKGVGQTEMGPQGAGMGGRVGAVQYCSSVHRSSFEGSQGVVFPSEKKLEEIA